MMKHVAVIGGGLAGSSAANWLTKHDYKVTVIERNDYVGGRIHSHLVQGAAVEMGAGFMTDAYTNLRSFMTENELSQNLFPQKSSSGIFRDGRVTMASPRVLLGNHPLSWSAKASIVPLILKTLGAWSDLDLHNFQKASKYDGRSVTSMFSGSDGKEFIEYVLQPILNGYFYWNPEHTSEAMMLILCKAAFSHGTYKMKDGLQRIPERAVADSTVLLNHTVSNVAQTREKYIVSFIHQGASKSLPFDGVIFATTANIIPAIFSDLTDDQAQFFKSIDYSSATLIAQTYKKEHALGNKSIAFPRKEGVELSTVTLSPEPGSGDRSLATVKTYASGTNAKKLSELSDESLTRELLKFSEPVHSDIFIGNPKPIATQVQRWQEAIPYFDVGHFKRLQAFEDSEIENPNTPVAFAGDYIGGPFMEGAFTSGIQAAERLDLRLQKK
jgi:protoporphyrinogen/coproporphyrinogen III oxidase